MKMMLKSAAIGAAGAWLILTSPAYALRAGSPSNLVYTDLHSHPQYRLMLQQSMLTQSEIQGIDTDDPNIVILPLSANGRKYVCQIPPPPELDNERREAEEDDEEAVRRKGMLDTALTLLDPLAKSKCLYMQETYWTYEICYGRHIRQFHDAIPGRDDKALEFFLGRYGAAAESLPGLPSKPHSASGSGSQELMQLGEYEDGVKVSTYVKQTWGGGTICDLTGLPRRTEVQFHCAYGPDHISFVTETGTCSYLITVNTQRLCTDAAFRPKFLHTSQGITCAPLPPPNLPALGDGSALEDEDRKQASSIRDILREREMQERGPAEPGISSSTSSDQAGVKKLGKSNIKAFIIDRNGNRLNVDAGSLFSNQQSSDGDSESTSEEFEGIVSNAGGALDEQLVNVLRGLLKDLGKPKTDEESPQKSDEEEEEK
ncbi:hypothetical protein BJ742DRAFT_42806 [Cladochytrium replicatum]|nr:hypothetical protein BJ742DRAFT_42806 [Cladochytrium replicatum]